MTPVLETAENTSGPPNGKLSSEPESRENAPVQPFVSQAKKAAATGSKGIIIFAAAAGLLLLVLMVVGLSTTKSKHRPNNEARRVNLGQQADSSEAPKRITPSDQLAPERQNDEDSVTAEDISHTKNSLRMVGEQLMKSAAGSSGSANISGRAMNAVADRSTPAGKPLATIPPFQQPVLATQPQQWTPQPYAGQPYATSGQQANTQELLRLAKEEVTKPSMVFTLKRQQATVQAAAGPAITNFGLEPGFHVAVRLEASASTAVPAAPVTAVVEYNYQRNGEILIPAGSRAIGKIDGADRNGNVSISFSTIDLPDGSPVLISAVAVDSNLRTIKGVVTGSNRGKGIIVGTLSGIGSAAAMLVGQSSSSMSAAYSQNDMIRDRLAQNAGSMGDSQVNRLIANEHIVVTVPAGTELYMVFTKAAVATKSNASAASNAGTGSWTTAPSHGSTYMAHQ
jgi:hypothetical protein